RSASEDGLEEIVVIVGPEGGIDPEELAQLREAGARSVLLGPEVLRSSTAGPAAIAVLSALAGRWGGDGAMTPPGRQLRRGRDEAGGVSRRRRGPARCARSAARAAHRSAPRGRGAVPRPGAP